MLSKIELLSELDHLKKEDCRTLKENAQKIENYKAETGSIQEPVSIKEFSQNFIIPKFYSIKDNKLIYIASKLDKREENNLGKQEKERVISRTAPILAREFINLERNDVYYEIVWIERKKIKREVVAASKIATKKELITLADKGLAVNDLNCKNLIDYFNEFLINNELKQEAMVEHLGHINDTLIHPLVLDDDINIIPADSGDKQLLEAFRIIGTVEGWVSGVFEIVKDFPKPLFLILSSFASVMLHDLRVPPFIVDLSGSTSKGKTTALQVARSIWGTDGLINEWNTTMVSIERKAEFLNSFPLFLDDSRKVDPHIIQQIIYQFSGGRSKGRGSLNGSQGEKNWWNILISTGEVSLTEYARKAGGAAARVITLFDEPFSNVNYKFFSELYEAINNDFGAIGLEFVRLWKKHKDSFIPLFGRFKEHYFNKAKCNEVLIRLSMYYAAVVFAGFVVKKLFQLDIDFKKLDFLYDEIADENKATDKPKQLLEQILLLLDSSRNNVYYDIEPFSTKAIFKFETICLTPAFLHDYLGLEEKMVRAEWLKKGYTQPFENRDGKMIDYKTVKHCNSSHRVIIVKREFIEDMGLDFNKQ
ncbi:DUF927 domain-containing protein [Cytobacillus dafuensis]|uniref:DUF927 domain-containing protein n=1 Tax=Cytobacillus dafuensis TaxID=1742359 RepID=UPI001624E51F|nr:DUF927 domain-containing protein [Cytobacillus dafuensis]